VGDPSFPLLRTFRFQVKLLKSLELEAGFDRVDDPLAAVNESSPDRLADGAFQECTGLDVDLDVQELAEGGRNDGVVRRVGRAKYQNLVLKRGMFHNEDRVETELWDWVQGVASGTRPIIRYDGLIEVMSVDENVVARWAFERGLPVKITGPQLNAKTGEVAIEELHIAHEGLQLVSF
jgi:phage tail-like protein